MSKLKNKTTGKNLIEKFDAGEDVSDYFDWSKATRPGLSKKRVNVDFPVSMLNRLDLAAQRHGSTRQAIIKHWLADRLKTEFA